MPVPFSVGATVQRKRERGRGVVPLWVEEGEREGGRGVVPTWVEEGEGEKCGATMGRRGRGERCGATMC